MGQEGGAKGGGDGRGAVEGATFAFSRRVALGEPARALAGHPM